MIISVKVPVNVFHQAAYRLKTNVYYVLHIAQEEVLSEMDDIQRFGMATNLSHPIIRVINEEDEAKWFLSRCESIQGNAIIFSYDILLNGIIEVTNQATLDLLNVTPYRRDDGWWDMVEEIAREQFRERERDAVCAPFEVPFEVQTSFEKFYMQRPIYRRLSPDTQPWTPYGELRWTIDHPDPATEFVTYLREIVQAVHSSAEPNLDKNKDVEENSAPALQKMSINELLFGGE